MKSEALKPYRGDQSFIFISYSHRNMKEAIEIAEKLYSKRYRVWYDEGIDPGTEWDENIAKHVKQCSYFIALLSKEYLESSNCKDELNYARDLEKPRLLIYLEDIQLPEGMRMRLSRLQAIHKYAYAEPEDFYEKLYSSKGIDICCSDSRLQDLSTQKVEINNGSGNHDEESERVDNYQREKEVSIHPYKRGETDERKIRCEFTIFSPVNVDVFINDKNHPLMKIDHYTGFDYQRNSGIVTPEFKLLFIAKGFEKEVSLDVPDDRSIKYRLHALLTNADIVGSYDREEALRQLDISPSAYAFEQLAFVGLKDDIPLIREQLAQLSQKMTANNHHNNCLIAIAIKAYASLSLKYHDYRALQIIEALYDNYPAKKSYGYIIEKAIEQLTPYGILFDVEKLLVSEDEEATYMTMLEVISKNRMVTLRRARDLYNAGSVAMFDFDTIMSMIKNSNYQIGKATADYLQLLTDISKRKGISVRKAESLLRSAGSK